MSLAKESWSSTLFGIMSGMGFVGPDLKKFTDAVGEGSVAALSGKTFKTTDSGTDSGTGIGKGTGLVGVAAGVVQSTIYSTAVSGFGSVGSDLLKLCTAVELALITEVAKASLRSVHAPVLSGTGIIDVGSVAVVGPEWGELVSAAGFGQSFVGSDWPALAKAIGIGCAAGFQTVTGKVKIAGSGGDSKSGVGVGKIS